MFKHSFVVISYFLSLFFLPISFSQECPDIGRLVMIGKELARTLKHGLCTHEINTLQVRQLEEKVLPEIMNIHFLGVQPPASWRTISHDLIEECYAGGNVCLKKEQEKVGQCLLQKLPLLMLTFTPWYYEHCHVINKTLISNWQTRQEQISRTISAALNNSLTAS
ncbi:MAG: hypothetical protein ACOVQX_00820 [Legionella sp.]